VSRGWEAPGAGGPADGWERGPVRTPCREQAFPLHTAHSSVQSSPLHQTFLDPRAPLIVPKVAPLSWCAATPLTWDLTNEPFVLLLWTLGRGMCDVSCPRSLEKAHIGKFLSALASWLHLSLSTRDSTAPSKAQVQVLLLYPRVAVGPHWLLLGPLAGAGVRDRGKQPGHGAGHRP
jgi:hypothetical protein